MASVFYGPMVTPDMVLGCYGHGYYGLLVYGHFWTMVMVTMVICGMVMVNKVITHMVTYGMVLGLFGAK